MAEFLQFAILGLGTGSIYALVSLGLVLIYRGSGVVNFSHGALALSGAAFFYEVNQHAPAVVAVLVAALGCAVVGMLIQTLIMGPMRGSSSLSRLIATLGLLAVGLGVWERVHSTGVAPRQFLPDSAVDLGAGITVPSSRLYLFAIAVVLGIMLWGLFRFTRFGLATAAVAENENVAAAQGWSPNVIAAANWALGGGLAGLAGALLFGLLGIDPISHTLIVIPALAAALLGGFRSYLATVAAALALGASQSLALLYIEPTGFTKGFREAIPLLAIVAVLVIRGRALPLRSFAADRLPSIGTGRIRPWLVISGAALLIATLHLFSVSWTRSVTVGTSLALVALSLVVLTGLAGQLSLAQWAVAGVACLFISRVAGTAWGLPMWLAFIVGTAMTIPFGLLLALPALRVRGVNLAIITLGLAVVIDAMILTNSKYTVINFSPASVPPPELFGIDLNPRTHPTRYATFAIVLVTLASLVVANLRRGQVGRRMIAIRGNENAAASLGISVLRVKAYAFAVASALAAVGGGIIAYAQTTVVYENTFPRLKNIEVVLLAVLGGIGYVGGALAAGSAAVAGMAEYIVGLVIDSKDWWPLISAVLLVLFVIFRPDGGIAYFVRDFKNQDHKMGSRLLTVSGVGLLISLVAAHTEWTEDGVRGVDFSQVSWARVVLVVGLLIALLGARRAALLVPAAAVVLAGLVGTVLMVALDDDLDLDGTWHWSVAACILAVLTAGQVLAREITERTSDPSPLFTSSGTITKVEPKELRLKNVTVTFGNVTAVSEASLSVGPGEVVGLIGPNGAGKTTMIEAITGFVPATGTVSIDSTDVSRRSATQRSQLGVARSFQSLELFEDMTVLDNLRTAADAGSWQPYLTDLVWPKSPRLTEAAIAAIEEFGLADVLDKKPTELPYATRRMVAIARALAAGPSIILLDEPAAGLDAGSTSELERLIRRLANDWGMAVMLIEHDVGLVMRTCDRIVALNFGKIIADGSPDEVAAAPAVIDAYLGTSA